jgi:molybdopterin molybdotransferase
VTFELFVAPILDRLGGQLRPAVRLDRGVVEDRLDKSVGRRGFFRVVVVRGENGSPLRDEQGRLRVRKAGLQGSHILSGMASADALAVVPEKVAVLEAGSEVEIRWLRG